MGAARLAELAWSRRNISRAATDEGELSRRTYPVMVALHTFGILVTALNGSDRPRLPWIGVLVAMQIPRVWVLGTLGRRWNTRGAVSADLEVETGGPYRFIRHPNYAVVAVELAALPLAFGMRRTAVAVSLINAGLLTVRIRDEERLLRRVPGWSEHFERRKRFIPGLF